MFKIVAANILKLATLPELLLLRARPKAAGRRERMFCFCCAQLRALSQGQAAPRWWVAPLPAQPAPRAHATCSIFVLLSPESFRPIPTLAAAATRRLLISIDISRSIINSVRASFYVQ